MSKKEKNTSFNFDIASILKDYGYKVLIDEYIENKNGGVINDF